MTCGVIPRARSARTMPKKPGSPEASTTVRRWSAAEGVEGLVEVLELDAFRAVRDRGGVEVPGRADDRSAVGEGVRPPRGRTGGRRSRSR